MNWFERHLNWTALLLGFGNLLLGLVCLVFAYRLSWPSMDFMYCDAVSSIPYTLVIGISLTLSALSCRWILLIKGRNPQLILLHVPAYILLISRYVPPVGDWIFTRGLILLYGVFVLGAGWFFVVFAKSSGGLNSKINLITPKQNFDNNRPTNGISIHILKYIHKKYFKYALIFLLLSVSVVSFSVTSFTNRAYYYPGQFTPIYAINPFSFNYPARLYYPEYFVEDRVLTSLEEIRLFGFNSIFDRTHPQLVVKVFDSKQFGDNLDNQDNKKLASSLFPGVNDYEYWNNENYSTKQTRVDRYSATQIHFTITEEQSEKFGSYDYAFFKYFGTLWVVGLSRDNIITNDAPEYFVDILKSFKVLFLKI
jgi:hypothetical protein